MKNRFKGLLSILFLLMFCLFLSGIFYGDTIFKKDRERVKGVIVEEYRDRVIVSTIDGEQKILRSDVKKIDYDLEEQNLTSMGDLYQDRGMYQDAYYYYGQALKINPQYKRAKEGLDLSGSMLQQTGRKVKLAHIQRMNEEKVWRSGMKMPEENMEAQLRRVLGFSVESYGANFKVIYVQKFSPADSAGLDVGDVIVAVWGRMVGYTRPEEFMAKVVSMDVMEVRLTIVKNLEIRVKDVLGDTSSLIGADVTYSETEGFEVGSVAPGGEAERVGLVPGDIFAKIEGESTRYMPLKEMKKMFAARKGKTIKVSVKRDISLWKSFAKK